MPRSSPCTVPPSSCTATSASGNHPLHHHEFAQVWYSPASSASASQGDRGPAHRPLKRCDSRLDAIIKQQETSDEDKRRKMFRAIGGAGVVAAAALQRRPAFAQTRPSGSASSRPRRASPARSASAACAARCSPSSASTPPAASPGARSSSSSRRRPTRRIRSSGCSKLVLQDKVDCVQGIVSSGVSLAMGAVAEEMKALLVFWDGTTQDGVKETMPKPALRLPQHRQRVRGGDGVAARRQALEGQVRDRRRHQPRLLLRPQQLRRLPGAAEEVRRRAQGGRRPVAEGRHASTSPRTSRR